MLLWNFYCLLASLYDVRLYHSTSSTCDPALAMTFVSVFFGFDRRKMMMSCCSSVISYGILSENDRVLSALSSSICFRCSSSSVVQTRRIPSRKIHVPCIRLHRVHCSLHRTLKAKHNVNQMNQRHDLGCKIEGAE